MAIFPWTVSLFPQGFQGLEPESSVFSEDSLKRWLGNPPSVSDTIDKRTLSGWSPALYEEGGSRLNSNVTGINAMAFDIDQTDLKWSGILVQLEDIGCPFFVHTTWSHTEETPRYRVVLFIDKAVAPNEYETAWQRASELVPDIDAQCKDLSRYYVSPAVPAGKEKQYRWYLHLDGEPLSSDDLMTGDQGQELTFDTILRVGPGKFKSVRELVKSPGKHKCACPFQAGSTFGSAFLRTMKDGRAFLQCTSKKHGHEAEKFWLSKKGANKPGRRSVTRRNKLVAELPKRIQDYAANRLAYSAPQSCYYRHDGDSWRIDLPWKREAVVAHLTGLLPEGYSEKHVQALTDSLLAGQAFGFGCSPGDGIFTEVKGEKRLNLYCEPNLERNSGDYPRINQVLAVLAGDNPDSANWLRHWMAALVQEPQRRGMIAVLFLSNQKGVGKTMMGRILSAIIGNGNCASVQNRSLRDRFNGHFITKLFVQADEVGIRKRHADVMDEIKVYITDERVPCVIPYAPRTEVDNRTTWWLTSNQTMPVVVEEDDRRFSVFECSEVDRSYKQMLRSCFNLQKGEYRAGFLEEISAFAYALEQVEVDWDLISRPIDTEVRTRIQEASRDSAELFCALLKEQGLAVMHTAFPPAAQFRVHTAGLTTTCPCRMLYGIYREWSYQNGRRDVRAENYFRLAVQSRLRVDIKRHRIGGLLLEVYHKLPASHDAEGKVIEVSFGNE